MQMLDRLEYDDNSEYIGEMISMIIELIDENDNLEMLENRELLYGVIKLFKVMHEKYLLIKNKEFFTPLFVFSFMFNKLSLSNIFVDLCIENDIPNFLAKNCILSEHFSFGSSRIPTEVISLGLDNNFHVYTIHLNYLNIFQRCLCINPDYCNENLFKNLLNYTDILRLKMRNEVELEYYVTILWIVILLDPNENLSEVFYIVRNIRRVFEVLNHLKIMPKNYQLEFSHTVRLYFEFIARLGWKEKYVYDLESMFNALLLFLESFDQSFHYFIFHSLKSIIIQAEYFNEISDTMRMNLQKFKTINANNYHDGSKHYANEFKKFVIDFLSSIDRMSLTDDTNIKAVKKSNKSLETIKIKKYFCYEIFFIISFKASFHLICY